MKTTKREIVAAAIVEMQNRITELQIVLGRVDAQATLDGLADTDEMDEAITSLDPMEIADSQIVQLRAEEVLYEIIG